MKLSFKVSIIAVSIISFSAYHAMGTSQDNKKVYTFDLDDVLNIEEKLGPREHLKFLVFFAKLGWNDPQGAAALIWNLKAIIARGYEVAEHVEGASNIIYALVQKLKNEGYPDLTNYVEEMVAITPAPKPIWQTVNYIKKLKLRGETVIAATNQDYIQNKYFRQKMKRQGVNLDELFDAILTSHSIIKMQKRSVNDPLLYEEVEKDIFMPASSDGYKPNIAYFDVLKAIVKIYAPSATTIIHTDDNEENIIAARKAGFKAVRFTLPKKSSRECTAAQLAVTFKAWKHAIEKFN